MRSSHKRHFVLDTDAGPLVTTWPMNESKISSEFRSGERRVFREHRVAGATIGNKVIPAPRPSSSQETSTNKGVGKKGAEKDAASKVPGGQQRSASALRRARGIPEPPEGWFMDGQLQGPPQYKPIPEEDERLTYDPEMRVKVGLEKYQPCAMCRHNFAAENLQHYISFKAILEQRAKWGKTKLHGADLKPTAMYRDCRICVFCAQFFGHSSAVDANASISEVVNSDSSPYLRKNVAKRVREYVATERAKMKAAKEQEAQQQEEGSFNHSQRSNEQQNQDGSNFYIYKPPDTTAPSILITPEASMYSDGNLVSMSVGASPVASPSKGDDVTVSPIAAEGLPASSNHDLNATNSSSNTRRASTRSRRSNASFESLNGSYSKNKSQLRREEFIKAAQQRREEEQRRGRETGEIEPTPGDGAWWSHRLPRPSSKVGVMRTINSIANSHKRRTETLLATAKLRKEQAPTVPTKMWAERKLPK